MSETIISEQIAEESNSVFLRSIITDGCFKRKLAEHMSESWTANNMNNVFSNSTQALLKFVSPTSPTEKMTKLLCLGKVQSGKTAFFISSIALAFDNGYSIAYVIGGTKNNLLSQNKDRILEEFSNNDDILIMDLNNAQANDIRQRIIGGCKVILMVLKHKSKNSDTNLASLEKLTTSLSDIPTLIVDDEGDERSPGNKKGTGQASNSILTAVKSVKRGTYLSVTATPQSNLLLSTTLENLTPDDCVLVEPGNGYTGANVFHDTMENTLVQEISDSDDFAQGVPDSFREALRFYILGCAVRYLREDPGFHSMLVHPSSKTAIQSTIYQRIKDELETIRTNISDESAIGYSSICADFESTYITMNCGNGFFPPFNDVLSQIKKNLVKTDVYQINTREGSDSQDDVGRDKYFKYKIYVGGNMLERGITLKNLAVTYIYRTAKKNPVDNTLQRARWFGYKKGYLDLCKVYMTYDMKKYFVDITNHENFLWETIRNYLKIGKPLQAMQRIFRLDNDQLILTRTSVAKTISVGSNQSGYLYDKSMFYENSNDPINNQVLIDDFMNSIQSPGDYYYYGKSSEHKHKYYKNLSFTDFYNRVLSLLHYPIGCTNVNLYMFQSIIESIKEGLMPDCFTLVKMRDGENQFRSTIADGKSIKELPESYQVTNGYVGDKGVFKDDFFIQLHYVYTDRENSNNTIPFLAVNNPFGNIRIRYVTGEFNV